MLTSFPSLIIKVIRLLPYVLIFNGTLFLLIGFYTIWSASSFISRATDVELLVVQIESKQSDDGQLYRPIFSATAPGGEVLRYLGNMWVSPKPHNQGDVVSGLVGWSSGEMKSVVMADWSKWFGTLFASLGGILFVVGGIFIWRMRRKLP